MALKFAMIIEAVDRFSRPGRRVQAAQRDMTKGARDLARSGAPAARAMDRMSAAATRMRTRLATTLSSVKSLAGRAGMKALEKAAYGAGYAIGWTIRKVASLAVGLAKLAGGAAIFGGGAFFGGVISTTAKFEQFQIILEGIEGSAEKAKASMNWVQSFAEKTPYELDQVMEAFVRLKTYGMDPMDGTLRSAGDAASSMGKDLMSAVEAIADAQTGEMERLKELGIVVRRQGGKVRMIYSQNGKDMEKVVDDNRAALREGVTGIWDELFGGGMARQATTFAGLINNLKDRWTGFMLRVGQAGIFDKVKGKLQNVLTWLDTKLADGSINRWATAVSDELGRVTDKITAMTDRDWEGFASDLKGVANGFLAIGRGAAWAAEKVAALIAWNDRMGARGDALMYENGENGWFTSDATKADARRKRRAIESEYGPMTETGRAEAQARRRIVPKVQSSPRASPLNLRGTPISPGASRAPAKAAPPVSGKVVLGSPDSAGHERQNPRFARGQWHHFDGLSWRCHAVARIKDSMEFPSSLPPSKDEMTSQTARARAEVISKGAWLTPNQIALGAGVGFSDGAARAYPIQFATIGGVAIEAGGFFLQWKPPASSPHPSPADAGETILCPA